MPPSTSTGGRQTSRQTLGTSPHNSRIKLKSTELKGGSQKKNSQDLIKDREPPDSRRNISPENPGNDPTSTPWTPVTTRHRAFKWTFFSRSGLFGGKSGIPRPGAESERFPLGTKQFSAFNQAGKTSLTYITGCLTESSLHFPAPKSA